MATYKLTQTFSNGTKKDVTFTIPEETGTYKLKFTLSDSTVIDAGNVVVGTAPSTYKINLAMTDGSNMSANILVPSIGYKVTIPIIQSGISALQYRYTNTSGDTSFVNASASSTITVIVQPNTSIQVYAYTLSDTAKYQAWTGNTTSWTINADTTLPAYYAQFKTSPTITSTSSTASSVSCAVKNNLSMTVYGMLYKSTSLNGTYTAAASRALLNPNSPTTITASGLSANTTYYWKVAYATPDGSIKEGPLSAATVTRATLPAYVKVTIPAKQSGVSVITYQYTSSTGTSSNINAGTSSQSITVKTSTTVTIKAYSFTSNDYQSWTGNITSWAITAPISLPVFYAQLKGTPTFSSYSSTTSSITVYWKNTLSTGYYIRASLYNGSSQVDYFDYYVAAGATSSGIKFTGLTRGKTYTAKAQYISTDSNIKSGELTTRSVSTKS